MHDAQQGVHERSEQTVKDPVCGMTVDPHTVQDYPPRAEQPIEPRHGQNASSDQCDDRDTFKQARSATTLAFDLPLQA